MKWMATHLGGRMLSRAHSAGARPTAQRRRQSWSFFSRGSVLHQYPQPSHWQCGEGGSVPVPPGRPHPHRPPNCRPWRSLEGSCSGNLETEVTCWWCRALGLGLGAWVGAGGRWTTGSDSDSCSSSGHARGRPHLGQSYFYYYVSVLLSLMGKGVRSFHHGSPTSLCVLNRKSCPWRTGAVRG